jgi:hypothetical protein
VKATVIHAARDIRLEDVPDPRIQRPTDAVVRVVASCICGSDLWPYRGVRETTAPHPIGHEFVGVVEQVGADVSTVGVGDFVVAPFTISDGTCPLCLRGVQTSCLNVGWWGQDDADGIPTDGGQGELVRVPLADGTLLALSEQPAAELVPDLLALSDVMGTGHHAAVSAHVQTGTSVVVVGGPRRTAARCRPGGDDVAEPGAAGARPLLRRDRRRGRAWRRGGRRDP